MDKFVSGETTFKYNPMSSEEVSVTVNNVTNMVNSIEDRLTKFETQTESSIDSLYEMITNGYSSLYDTINEKSNELNLKINDIWVLSIEKCRSLESDINYMNDKLSHMYQFLSWFFSPLLHLLLSPIGQLWNYITGSYIVNVEVTVLSITDDEDKPIQRKYLIRQMIFLDKSVYSRKKRLQMVRENHPKWKKEWKKLKKEKPVVPMDTKSIVQFI